jgi:uncharacterized protein
MPVDHIRYDLLTQDALREVIRRVLADAAVNGLPGDHHFFVTFDTRADGVRMSPRLRSSYPEDMTIVLQHQFWDLAVGDADFEVGLAFNGIPERLFVPFKAVKGFFDPSVQFLLQFTVEPATIEGAGHNESGTAEAAKMTSMPQVVAPADVKRAAPAKKLGPELAAKPATGSESAASEAEADKTPGAPAAKSPEDAVVATDDGTSQVVRLDRFRKK